jgi:hypothetical protein
MENQNQGFNPNQIIGSKSQENTTINIQESNLTQPIKQQDPISVESSSFWDFKNKKIYKNFLEKLMDFLFGIFIIYPLAVLLWFFFGFLWIFLIIFANSKFSILIGAIILAIIIYCITDYFFIKKNPRLRKFLLAAILIIFAGPVGVMVLYLYFFVYFFSRRRFIFYSMLLMLFLNGYFLDKVLSLFTRVFNITF